MTRRADDTPTGNPRVTFRLPRDAYAALTDLAGLAVPGKSSGVNEWVRQLVLRALGLEEADPDERHRAASVRPGRVYGEGYRARRRAEGRPISRKQVKED